MKLFRNVEKYALLLLPLLIVCLFFYKFFLLGQIPFPGDLLVGTYEPYKSMMYEGYAPGGVPNKAQGPDVIKELLPWKHFIVESYKSGQIPFWNPYNFSGNPLMANFQSAVFYPTNIIFFLTDFNTAWSLYIFIAPLMAFYFTYLFIRRLGLSYLSAILGGGVFSFSSYMSVWIQYGNIGNTFVWLPLMLYFSDKLLEKVNLKNYIGFVLAGFLCFIAGYIQGVFYIYATVFFYFFIKGFLEKSLNKKNLIIFLVGVLLPVGLSGFQLFPTLEIFGLSTRGNYTLSQIQEILNPVYYLITVVVPDFYGNPAARNYWLSTTYIERVSYFGLIPLMLAFIAAFSLFRKIEVKIFSVVFFASIILATDLFVTRYFYLIPIPVLSTTIATRILVLFAFSGSILSAFGLSYILNTKKNKGVVLLSLVFVFILGSAFVGLSLFPQVLNGLNAGVAKRNLILPIFSAFVFFVSLGFLYKTKIFTERKTKIIFSVVIIIVVFADLFYYFQKITPFSPSLYMYPETPVVSYLEKNAGINRYWGYGGAYIESNFQTFDQTFSPEGNDPLHIKEYTELVASSGNGKVPKVLPRPDANIAPGFGLQDFRENRFRQKVLDVAGIKYVLNKNEGLGNAISFDSTFPEDKYKLVFQEGFWQVYENKNVLPRLWLTNNFIVDKNDNFTNNFYNIDSRTLILNDIPGINKGNIDSAAELVLYSPNKVVAKTDSSQSAMLYLSDNYFPGWKAFVDGQQVKIFRANHAFRAVEVEKGEHVVVFEYKPKSFSNGVLIATISFVLFIGSCFLVKKNEK